MVVLALRRLQVENVGGDAVLQRELPHLLGAEAGRRQRRVALARAGVGDHDQVATAEAGPVDALDRLDQAGVAVLGERACRDLRGGDTLDRVGELRLRRDLGRVGEGAHQVLDPLDLGRIVAVGDHAEAHPLIELRRLDLRVNLLHRRAGEVDVRLHRGAGVDDEDDSGSELGEVRFRIDTLAGLRQRIDALLLGYRGDLHRAYLEARLQHGGTRIEDRQQVELLLHVDESLGLDRDDRAGRRQLAVGDLPADLLAVDQQLVRVQHVDQSRPVLEEQHPLAVGGVGERQRQAVLPRNGVRLRQEADHPAFAVRADFEVVGGAGHLLAVDEQQGHRRQLLPAGAARLRRNDRARPGQHPLVQRRLALDQQRLARPAGELGMRPRPRREREHHHHDARGDPLQEAHFGNASFACGCP